MTELTQTDDGAQTAYEAALELGRELAESGSLATQNLRVHEDQMDDRKVSLRLRLPNGRVHPQMLTALGERGFWLEYLGEDDYGRTVYAIQTGRTVHEGVY